MCHKEVKQIKEHIDDCGNNPSAVIRMPKTSNNLYKFNHWSATWFAPLVIYFDFESILKPVASCPARSESTSNRSIEIHVICGFLIAVIEHCNPQPKFSHLDSSVIYMQNFEQMICKFAKDVCEQKRKYPFNRSNFFGWAHPQCNRARRNSNFIPVIGHKIQNYDLHHICLSLQQCEPTTTIKVIPSTDEKYITMVLGVKVSTFEKADKKFVPIYEYLRFVGSFELFSGSLEKLVEMLPDSEFAIMESMFANNCHSEHHILKEEGFTPTQI